MFPLQLLVATQSLKRHLVAQDLKGFYIFQKLVDGHQVTSQIQSENEQHLYTTVLHVNWRLDHKHSDNF